MKGNNYDENNPIYRIDTHNGILFYGTGRLQQGQRIRKYCPTNTVGIRRDGNDDTHGGTYT